MYTASPAKHNRAQPKHSDTLCHSAETLGSQRAAVSAAQRANEALPLVDVV